MKTLRFLLVILAFGSLLSRSQAQHWEWVNPVPCNNILNDIFFTDAQHGIICGSSGTILKTVDGGVSWQQKYSGVSDNLLKIWMMDSNNGIVIGHNTILKTSDGGENWVLKQSLDNVVLTALHFPNAGTGYIVGSGGVVLRTLDGGESWNVISTGSCGNPDGVWFITPSLGFTTEGDSYDGHVYRTTNGGFDWNQIPQRFYPLNSLRFLDASTGMAWGSEGTIYRTTNGGNNWDLIYQNQALSINSIVFAGLNTAYALCDQMIILKTTDGGTTWNNTYSLGPFTNMAGWFTSPNQGWILGFPDYNNPNLVGLCSTNDGCQHLTGHVRGYTTSWSNIAAWQNEAVMAAGDSGMVLKSSDAGNSWTKINTGVTYALRDITFSGANSIYAVGVSASIVHSSDGGINWERQNPGISQDLNAVSFPAAGTGYIAGQYGTLLKTTNGGLNWSVLNPGIMNHLLDVQFLDENTGYVCGSSGTILKTTNGGSSWSTLSTGTSNDFACMYFLNDLTGYLGSFYGILKTTDGGQTWEYLEIGNFGSIKSIFFRDEMTGLMTNDQGEIYMTADAGHTWTRMISNTASALRGICMDAGNNFFVAGDHGVILRNHNLNVGTVEIAKPAEAGLLIFPNPAGDHITVQETGLKGTGRLSIINSLGMTVISMNIDVGSQYLNVSGLAPGVYFVIAEAEEFLKTGMFVKK